MDTLLPKCEACGADDAELRAALMRAGKVDLGPQPSTHALLLCGDCRKAQIALIQQVKGEPEEAAAAAGA